MLKTLWDLISGVIDSVWGLFHTLFIFIFESLSWLHFEAPRLEGLIFGVLLAWLLSRRESHPIINILSAPLKISLDILDLLWDKGFDLIKLGFYKAKYYFMIPIYWTLKKTGNSYSYIMKKLGIIKEDLKDNN